MHCGTATACRPARICQSLVRARHFHWFATIVLQRQRRLAVVPLLAELPASCRALAFGGDAVEALGTLGRIYGLGLAPEDGGGAGRAQASSV